LYTIGYIKAWQQKSRGYFKAEGWGDRVEQSPLKIVSFIFQTGVYILNVGLVLRRCTGLYGIYMVLGGLGE